MCRVTVDWCGRPGVVESCGGRHGSQHPTTSFATLLIIVQSTTRRRRRRRQQWPTSFLMTEIDCEFLFISSHLFTVSTESLDVGQTYVPTSHSYPPRPLLRYSVWELTVSFPFLPLSNALIPSLFLQS